MVWKDAVIHFINQLSESFIILQTLPEFSELDVHVKVLIARQRLWKFSIQKKDILVEYVKGFEYNLELVKWLINTKDAGLLSIFEEGFEEIFNMEGILIKNELIQPS